MKNWGHIVNCEYCKLLDYEISDGCWGVIIPGTVNLSFKIELTSTIDANRTLVSNIGRAIVKKLAVKFEGNEIMTVDDYDTFACYQDLWKTKSEKRDKASSLVTAARKTALN